MPLSRDVLVKHAYGNVYDAFWDSGWKNWTRFLYRRGEVLYIKGQFVNKQELAQLKTIVQKMDVTEHSDQIAA